MASIKLVPQAAKAGDQKRVDAEVEKLTKEGYEVYETNRRHVKLRKTKKK